MKKRTKIEYFYSGTESLGYESQEMIIENTADQFDNTVHALLSLNSVNIVYENDRYYFIHDIYFEINQISQNKINIDEISPRT